MRHGRVDQNQKNIVKALEKCGFTVQSLADVGNGVPDLLFAGFGNNYLAEVKNPAKKPSQRKLTPAQIDFGAKWRGEIYLFETIDDVLSANDKIRSKLKRN